MPPATNDARGDLDAQIVYIAETERDAEALQFEGDNPVQVRPQANETLIVDATVVRVTRSVLRRSQSNNPDSPLP